MTHASSFSLHNLCFDPLTNHENVIAFDTLSRIVRSSIGPRGKLKIVRNSSGGHSMITSSSQRLFQSTSIKNILIKSIISSVRSHSKTYKDGGLKCAFLILSLIEHSHQCEVSISMKATLYEFFCNSFLECLKCIDNECSSRIDITNLSHLKAIVLSILSSKPGCVLSKNQKTHLFSLLLKAFLNLFPSSTTVLESFNIRVLSSEGYDVKESKLFNGLLIKVSKTDWTLLPKKDYSSAKVAFFTVSLAGDVDFPVKNLIVSNSVSIPVAVLKHLRGISLKLISEKVDFVFCQKVVHPNLKKQLNDAGLTVFDQLGNEAAGFLQYVLGDSVNSSLFTELSFGFLSCSKEQINENYYILIQNGHPICSLLLCHYNEEALLELKIVCMQILYVLYQLLVNPTVCYGAGCTDIYTAIIFMKKLKKELPKIAIKFGCTNSNLLSVLHSFLHNITDLAVSSHQISSMEFVTETTHGHLWKTHLGDFPSNEQTCCCGCYSASAMVAPSWYHLNDLELVSDNFQTLNYKPSELESVFNDCVLDNLACKIASFKTAAQTALSFLRTDLCIFTGRQCFETNS